MTMIPDDVLEAIARVCECDPGSNLSRDRDAVCRAIEALCAAWRSSRAYRPKFGQDRESQICVYCGKAAEGNFSIHRDGFEEGPEVPLCDNCGRRPLPFLDQIWAKISQKNPPASTVPAGILKRDFERLWEERRKLIQNRGELAGRIAALNDKISDALLLMTPEERGALPIF